MREVLIFKYEKADGKPHFDKVADGVGRFHEWGSNYEEFENGAGNFSTAIIERPDGTVENVPVELIKFTDRWGAISHAKQNP